MSRWYTPETVYYDPNTFGVTGPSLKLLRDTLITRADHYICVVEVPTDDGCCGYAIYDRDKREVIFSGDGFRPDRGGEGGAGYNTAEAIFRIFRITPLRFDEFIPLAPVYTGKLTGKAARDHLLTYFIRVANKAIVDRDFQKPLSHAPHYIRRPI